MAEVPETDEFQETIEGGSFTHLVVVLGTNDTAIYDTKKDPGRLKEMEGLFGCPLSKYVWSDGNIQVTPPALVHHAMDRIAQVLELGKQSILFVEPPGVPGDKRRNHRIDVMRQNMQIWGRDSGVKIVTFEEVMMGEDPLLCMSEENPNQLSTFYCESLSDIVQDWAESIKPY